MTTSKHQFCMRCGEALTLLDAESVRRLACPGCGLEPYQNPVGASAGLVLRGEEVLLVQRGIEPFKGAWAIPAGYQDADESPPQAAEREILEETGVEVEAYMLLDLLWVPDDPRKPANVALFACRAIGGEASGADDAMDARWFPLDALPEELAFDNKAQVFDRLGPDGDLRAMLDLLGGNSSSGFVD